MFMDRKRNANFLCKEEEVVWNAQDQRRLAYLSKNVLSGAMRKARDRYTIVLLRDGRGTEKTAVDRKYAVTDDR